MKKNNMYFVHILIGLAIMFVFRFIPVGILPHVTEVGMQILGIFIGTIYLWTTIDPTVSSLISISMSKGLCEDKLSAFLESKTSISSLFNQNIFKFTLVNKLC